MPPDVSDVLPAEEPAVGFPGFFKGPSLADKREKERLQLAQTWGVWLWLVAELVPHGTLYTPSCMTQNILQGCIFPMTALAAVI